MVQNEGNNTNTMGTRLQSTVTAHGEQLAQPSSQYNELSSSMNSMRELMESMFLTLQKLNGKRILVDPEGGPSGVIVDDGGGSSSHGHGHGHGSGAPPRFHQQPPDAETSIFSLPRVQLSLFDGTDPRGWISKADLYFQLHHTPADHRMALVQMCMDKVALHWFTNLLSKSPDITWEQFKLKLMVRFSGSKFRNPYEALGSLFQNDTVEEYIDEFESLSALISGQRNKR